MHDNVMAEGAQLNFVCTLVPLIPEITGHLSQYFASVQDSISTLKDCIKVFVSTIKTIGNKYSNVVPASAWTWRNFFIFWPGPAKAKTYPY